MYRHYGIRVSHLATKAHMLALLELRARVTPDNPINRMRTELIAYVAQNKQRLSLFCSGNCYEHMDAVVLNCHRQLLQATHE